VADRLGRYVLTGMAVGSLFISAAVLVAQGYPYVGAAAAFVGAAWVGWHNVLRWFRK
jgi:hypothetical protein